jgi:hypothetical protein
MFIEGIDTEWTQTVYAGKRDVSLCTIVDNGRGEQEGIALVVESEHDFTVGPLTVMDI